MSPDALEFAKKLAEGARAKAAEDQRRLQAIRNAKAEASKPSHSNG
ncbi:MAG TPA: hypothetical protein VMU92_11410 [Acidobacteriaceae bacterium]|nr:hypothetical protein [Acidobacteriaceae bacterium]